MFCDDAVQRESHTQCQFCDNNCFVKTSTKSGTTEIKPLDPQLPAMCSKALVWDEYRHHKDRITVPLKNIGVRGEPDWVELSWEQALDEIAERLKKIIEAHGPEAVGFSETPLNHGFGGITRRLMNALGTPNYLAPTEMCMGNTAQVHRATYGWLASSNWDLADVIVYFGQDRDGERWPKEYLRLKAAQQRGAKLIVIDPRLTDTAKRADYHLRIRYGTDAALTLAWLNVIIAENLYDKDFVDTMTIGFDELKARVHEYTPEWAAEVCCIEAEVIRETARVYAHAKAAIIPWGVVGDMQRNSTSLLRCQCILRAICGYLNTSELVFGPSAGARTNAEISAFESLSEDKKALQLGSDTYPLLSFRGGSLYEETLRDIGVDYYPDMLAAGALAHPPALFAAMRGEGPYPVKAFFSVANNTVMSYANQKGIVEAFLNQDLVVVFEHNMTPTAQLADYVLPGDMWAERDILGGAYDFAPINTCSQRFVDPVGACKDWYFVVKGLADRLGLDSVFPWRDSYELFDYRLEPVGITWQEAQQQAVHQANPLAFGKFLTLSGKVELKSSVFEALGYDPLPYYHDHTEQGIDATAYPFTIYAGSREAESYNTNLHQIETLRERQPEPLLFINPVDASDYGITDGNWVEISTTVATIKLMARIDEAQPEKTLRIPHGWWKPESTPGLEAGLSSAMHYNDGMLFSDTDWNLDPEQGLPNLRGGIQARITLLDA